MRIFFSVGEPSGDLHASNLIRHLKTNAAEATETKAESASEIECVGFGGPKMAAAGCELHYDLTQQAVMFFEAIKQLPLFFGLIKQADQYFAQHKPDAVVLIDYAGFNWWIARKAKKHGIPVFFYGVPQVWAWAPWRLKKIQRFVDHVLCKLPFEQAWFAQRGCTATYVGHPYFDEIAHQQIDESFLGRLNLEASPLLTLLPGSRDQEVKSVLPVLLASADKIIQQVPSCRVAIASYNQKQAEMAQNTLDQYRDKHGGLNRLQIEVGHTPELMRAATVCLACSGSVSMELMHYRKPTIIVFKISRWMMWLQSMLLKTKFITLVNLIETDDIRKTTWRPFDPDAEGAEQAVMPEYLTTGNPSDKVAARVVNWLTDEPHRQQTIQRLNQLADQYARPGATQRAADYLMAQLNPKAESLVSPNVAQSRLQPASDTRKTA